MVLTSSPYVPLERYRITVVCLGNICRSPMAEVVLRSRLSAAGLAGRVVVDSAGTGTWHTGYGADERTRQTLTGHGYPDLPEHTARRITPNWFAEIDLVLAMDEHNYADLARLIASSGVETELRMMRSFDSGLGHLPEPSPALDVPDPYYGGPDGFEDALRMIERASDGVVGHIPATSTYEAGTGP
jgi:protein-tyrosine phosphatase